MVNSEVQGGYGFYQEKNRQEDDREDIHDKRAHCQCNRWGDAAGPQRHQGGDARKHYGVLHGRWGRIGRAAGRSRAGSLPGFFPFGLATVTR